MQRPLPQARRAVLMQNQSSRPSKISLIIEFSIICIGVPFTLIYFRLAPYMFIFLWSACALCVYLYKKTPDVKGADIWKWNEVNSKNLKPILIRFIISTILLIPFVYAVAPERAFGLLTERPEIWWRVMILYPLLSAAPQEFIFCTYFFARYKYLFTNQKFLLAAATIIFACTHILYINWVAPVLSAFAGYFFAQTYMRTRSLALVSLEHALYGNMIFTLGLGYFFFGGRVD
jgi:membrane protease YdiL (CAAX protease family)